MSALVATGAPSGARSLRRSASARDGTRDSPNAATSPADERELQAVGHHREPNAAIGLLERWLKWARRCRLEPFVKLARTITDQRAECRRDPARTLQRVPFILHLLVCLWW
jgi:transposase